MKRIKVSLPEILNVLGDLLIQVKGSLEDVYIDNLSDAAKTNLTTLDWVNSAKKEKQHIAENSKAKVILVDSEVEYSAIMAEVGKILIVVNNPKIAIAKVGNAFFIDKVATGIHPTAIIDSEAVIGENVSIAPYCVIGKVEIGNSTRISSFVKIYDNVTIGENCFIKEGAVVGGPGFGFEKDENGNRFRFPQIGGVVIGNNVEIGANTCIDKGALSDTVIEDYAKIDNLCYIAHNVHLGKNVMITACSEISGSCVIEDEVWTGPNTSVRDQRKIGKCTLVGIGSNVVKDIPSNEVWAGNPAKKIK